MTLTAAASPRADAWTVGAIDLTGEQEGGRYVDVALDRTRVSAGDVVPLTLTALRAPPDGRSIVGVVSAGTDGTFLWPVAVVMR